jgi:CRISPR-associated protein Csb1
MTAIAADLDRWASDPDGPVALHIAEELSPVEGPDGVFFPPTYADVGYNIDTLSDGTKVALIDSVGSQANRIEPIFQRSPFSSLVPQVRVAYGDPAKQTDGAVNLLDVGHRLGDALLRCTPLREEVQAAFAALLRSGDATAIARLAPTSLVFGVWDSRGSMAKVPRILQSTIRAWDVSPLTRSAQYKPPLDYAALEVFSAEDRDKAEGKKESPLAQRGFVDVPATATHGGVVAAGPIRRDLTVNLVALRRLRGADEAGGVALRRYVLGLALVAAAEPTDPFLRQGCQLVPREGKPPVWTLVHRDGRRQAVTFSRAELQQLAQGWAKAFGVGPDRDVQFDKTLARDEVAKTKESGGGSKKAKK